MANPIVADVFRPDSFTRQRVDEETYEDVQAELLIATIDHNADGTRLYQISLPFADYPGLEGEWQSGEETALLKAAITQFLISPGAPADHMTALQRAQIVGYEIALE